MHLGYFHDKQTGDLMSRVINDTRDFELLYAHIIPESITNLVTFVGVLIVLLFINAKLSSSPSFPFFCYIRMKFYFVLDRTENVNTIYFIE